MILITMNAMIVALELLCDAINPTPPDIPKKNPAQSPAPTNATPP